MKPYARIHSLLAKGFTPPGKDWARKLLDDPHATELQKRMAKEALEPRVRRDRQPGDDDAEVVE